MQQLLKTSEAALILGVSESFLERDRWGDGRIPFIKVGARAVRYRESDLQNYLDKQQRRSTSDKGQS